MIAQSSRAFARPALSTTAARVPFSPSWRMIETPAVTRSPAGILMALARLSPMIVMSGRS